MVFIIGMIVIIILYSIFIKSDSNKRRTSSKINRARELHNKSDYRGRVSQRDINEYYLGRAEDERKIQRGKSEVMQPLWFLLVIIILGVLASKIY